MSSCILHAQRIKHLSVLVVILEVLFFKIEAHASQEMNHFIIVLGLGAGAAKCITIYYILNVYFAQLLLLWCL